MYTQHQLQRKYQNQRNNAQGRFFENYISSACVTYAQRGIAQVEKVPEPFRVMKKFVDGTFTGRFIALAQPDFQGTLKGGRSIVFEAKYTSTDRITRRVLTDKQMEMLENHMKLGALTGICTCIVDKFYFIPWETWRDMKILYGRQYLKTEDIEEYRVRFNGSVMFLDYINK
jgi:recombination protein U